MDLQLQCYLLVVPPASLFFYLTYSLLDLSLSLSVFLPCLSVPPQSVPQCLLFLTQFLSLSLPDSPPSVCLPVSQSVRPSICICLRSLYVFASLLPPLSLWNATSVSCGSRMILRNLKRALSCFGSPGPERRRHLGDYFL